MILHRRKDDRTEHSAVIRVIRDGKELFSGEIIPGHIVELEGGIRVEFLWTRTHYPPEDARR